MLGDSGPNIGAGLAIVVVGLPAWAALLISAGVRPFRTLALTLGCYAGAVAYSFLSLVVPIGPEQFTEEFALRVPRYGQYLLPVAAIAMVSLLIPRRIPRMPVKHLAIGALVSAAYGALWVAWAHTGWAAYDFAPSFGPTVLAVTLFVWYIGERERARVAAQHG